MARKQSSAGKKRSNGRFHGRVEHSDGRQCDWPGCTEPGEFKAPKQAPRRSDEPPHWHWFCLEHVRQHNEAWNYFDSLSPEDYIKERQAHPSWDGPTFPFRMNPEDLASLKMRDAHGIFHNDPRFRRFAQSPEQGRRPVSAQEAMAFATLELEESAGAEDIKRQYKALLKRYHPDANGGDRRGEKKMRSVIAAYHVLMDGGGGTR